MSLHKKLEENIGLLIFGILFVSSLGGLVQILPLLNQDMTEAAKNTRVYSALELTGRDIYIREGCSVCHSQQVRPLIAEIERYGPYSRAEEFIYDRPFLWGSKRTGPDLHRVGGKFSDDWHRVHLVDPRAVVSESIMPGYPWLARRNATQAGNIVAKMRGLRYLGHPYSDEDIEAAPGQLEGLKEIDALIVYLQRLGTAYTGERSQ
ncbi:MAG: cytochrome-c oxidase, cbb3-type subunit II [SAR86 cluster bacterium]|uniref:Cytochrome-c oxidase, cbb3-type subunit II n=1 Tax=SAR86 cluster bacterium TaxID=2030880 RepID=A0A2A5AZY2_9GAMM|nr:MAG: cytochrome-c oxidase, cbb3-type subunit II [SAR86 cluster bacterium]